MIGRVISVVIPMIALLVSLVALVLSGIQFYANVTYSESNAEATRKQLCLNWLQFVLAERAEGIPIRRIDREGVAFSWSSRDLGSGEDIIGLCGSAAWLLGARHTDRPLASGTEAGRAAPRASSWAQRSLERRRYRIKDDPPLHALP